jgi:hypothetical protein
LILENAGTIIGSMQKNVALIISVIILVLLLGGGLFLFSKQAKTTPQIQTQKIQNLPKTETQKTPSTITGTIKDLLSGGKTQACTINYPNDMGTGNIYVADKKFGGDFTIKTDGEKDITGYMISDGTYMYSWSDDKNTGIKMNLAEAQKQVPTAQTEQKSNLDLNQKLDFKCMPWTIDNSKFSVPTAIKFTDLTKMIQKLPSAATDQTENAASSSSCDQITDPTIKEACVNVLKNTTGE